MGEEPAFARKVDGYMASKDFLEGNLRENVYTIRAVEMKYQHPDIRGADYFLRFEETEQAFVVNRINGRILRYAYGRFWSGKKIRIEPVERDWDGTKVWALEITPLKLCTDCNKEYTQNMISQLCPWCEITTK